MPSRTSPAEALELLKEGNLRFVAGTTRREAYGPQVAELKLGQSPFAIVLGCSDSRVPIETVFDQDPGKLFVVRVAGNFLNNDNLGTIEFGVDVLKAKLIVVLG
ncbi:MAG TPA: carbonic anhydrase, partial [Candidatus Nitrosotalea sp.]|nr:carbonic anhydrase [Candidatus Nitrosotalea sp.]